MIKSKHARVDKGHKLGADKMTTKKYFSHEAKTPLLSKLFVAYLLGTTAKVRDKDLPQLQCAGQAADAKTHSE